MLAWTGLAMRQQHVDQMAGLAASDAACAVVGAPTTRPTGLARICRVLLVPKDAFIVKQTPQER